MWAWVHRLGAPERSFSICERYKPWLGWLSLLLFCVAAYEALWVVPADYQQGDAYRVLFIHVPCAMLSLGCYAAMTVAEVVAYVWGLTIASIVSRLLAPLGLVLTCLTLMTGSLWGRPTWGTYWIWDARLTSELILGFIYLGIIALRGALPNTRAAERIIGLLTCIGAINLPIIHYSVQWWHTLHQGATVLRLGKPNMAPEMLPPLFFFIVAFVSFAAWWVMTHAQRALLIAKCDTQWVNAWLKRKSS